MTVAQIRTIAKLVYDAELTEDRKVQTTTYVSGDIRLRFMDKNGNILNYMIAEDGSSVYEPPGV